MWLTVRFPLKGFADEKIAGYGCPASCLWMDSIWQNMCDPASWLQATRAADVEAVAAETLAAATAVVATMMPALVVVAVQASDPAVVAAPAPGVAVAVASAAARKRM